MHSILTVHLIETKFVLMLLSKNTFKLYIQQSLCYIIPTLAPFAIETMLYRNLRCIMIFFKRKIIMIYLETIDIKRTSDKFYMHTYLMLTLFMLFNIT